MKKIKIGLVGCSRRGGDIANSINRNDDFELVSMCDIHDETLRKARGKYGCEIAFEHDYSKMIERPDLDAVAIATPQFNHRDLAVQAFQHGKHVFCEKPLAIDIKQCDEMIQAAKAAGKVLIVGQQMRYHLHLQKMASLLASGEIGRPVMLWLREFRGPFRVSSTHMWIFDKKKSGGMLVEKSCHHFDLFNWFADSKAVSVYASAGQDYFHEHDGMTSTIDDNAWVTVNYENGARASLGLCMFLGRPHPTEGEIGYHNREIGVAGPKGLITTEGDLPFRAIDIRYSTNRNSVRINMSSNGLVPDKFNQEGNVGILFDFAECIRTGKEPFANGEIGRDALAISLAAEKSIAEKRLVAITEIE